MAAHAEFLRAASGDARLAEQVVSDYREAAVSTRNLRMLEFAEKLTRTPWHVAGADRDALRAVGFSEIELLHVVLGCAQFNYFNRMADGLGIRLEYATSLKHSDDGSAPARASFIPCEPSLLEAARSAPPPPAGVPEPVSLPAALRGNPEAAAIARDWRQFQLRPTEVLDARRRAGLAELISILNGCGYGTSWSRRARGEAPWPVDALDRRLIDHAETLTREPWRMTESRIEELRRSGLDDMEVLRLTMLISYVNFENRVVQGLGVRLEGACGEG